MKNQHMYTVAMATTMRRVSEAFSGTKKLISRLVLSVFLLGVMIACMPAVSSAISSQYQTDDLELKVGMAVAVAMDTSKGDTLIERAGQSSASRTLGIATDNLQDVSIVVTPDNTRALFSVATSGEAQVFVTDLNGVPEKGDLLAPSPIRGVLMRASEGTEGVMGVALQSFPDDTAETVQVQADRGERSVKVGVIGINMDVKTAVKNDKTVNFLQQFGEALVGRPVSAIQVFVAMTILILLIVTEGGIIYATISNYVTSLGRNPLAKDVLHRGLMSVSGLVAAVFALGIGAIYLVLWM